jgi:hypothetical protein
MGFIKVTYGLNDYEIGVCDELDLLVLRVRSRHSAPPSWYDQFNQVILDVAAP